MTDVESKTDVESADEPDVKMIGKLLKTKYISMFPTKRKREAEAWAKKRFVEGTYVIKFYEPSKYYHVYVLQAEARYWVETTTESVCGNCSCLIEKNYTDGTQVQLCDLQRKDAYGISTTRCTSLGRTCEEHKKRRRKRS